MNTFKLAEQAYQDREDRRVMKVFMSGALLVIATVLITALV